MLIEPHDDTLPIHWFVGLTPDEPIRPANPFTTDCERLLNERARGRLPEPPMAVPEAEPLPHGELPRDGAGQ